LSLSKLTFNKNKGSLIMDGKKFVQITFSVTRKTGVISFLMLNAGKIGLLYNKKFERHTDEDISEVIVYYSGKTDLSNDEVIESFEKHSGVVKVEDIAFVSRADMRNKPRPDVAPA